MQVSKTEVSLAVVAVIFLLGLASVISYNFGTGGARVSSSITSGTTTVTTTQELGVLWQGMGRTVNVTDATVQCSLLASSQQLSTWGLILQYVINDPALGALVQQSHLAIELPVYACVSINSTTSTHT